MDGRLKTLGLRVSIQKPRLNAPNSASWTDEHRCSRHARGYGTAWDKLRILILKRDCYVCQCDECRSLCRIRPANEVDHRTPKAKGGSDDPNNLQAINAECHVRKTGRDRSSDYGGVS